ncbi:hypothetical protein ACJX0J_008106, partial [Zea mays]
MNHLTKWAKAIDLSKTRLMKNRSGGMWSKCEDSFLRAINGIYLKKYFPSVCVLGAYPNFAGFLNQFLETCQTHFGSK